MKQSDVASPVHTKAPVCPALAVAAFLGLGPSRDSKIGFIYPDFYGYFIVFKQLNTIKTGFC